MRPKIGLVLGGGGSRGLAHVGILEVLEREGIAVDFIVGTSMGGIVGALYAYGFHPSIIAKHMKQLGGSSLFVTRIFSARARQNLVRDYLAEAFEDKTFDDLKIPLTVMAVDMQHGREVELKSGPLIPSLLATSAVPAVFPPVELDGMQLADGGVIDSLATHVAYAQGADVVIGVDVYARLETEDFWNDPLSDIMGFASPFNFLNINSMPSMLAAVWRSVRVMTWHLHQTRIEHDPPHVLMRPEVDHYGSLDFRDVEGPVMAGVVEAERHLARIKALIQEQESQENN